MEAQFTALDYDLSSMSDQEIEGAISVCKSNTLLGLCNLNALFEENYRRAGRLNPIWNTPAVATDEQARALYRRYAELCMRVEKLTMASDTERHAAARKRDDFFDKVLELRNVTFDEWLELNSLQRKAVWGFQF